MAQKQSDKPEAPTPDPILARMQQIEAEVQQMTQQAQNARQVLQNLETQITLRTGAYRELERMQEAQA